MLALLLHMMALNIELFQLEIRHLVNLRNKKRLLLEKMLEALERKHFTQIRNLLRL